MIEGYRHSQQETGNAPEAGKDSWEGALNELPEIKDGISRLDNTHIGVLDSLVRGKLTWHTFASKLKRNPNLPPEIVSWLGEYSILEDTSPDLEKLTAKVGELINMFSK